ncbi:unnamed protein product [Sphagnum balticum]
MGLTALLALAIVLTIVCGIVPITSIDKFSLLGESFRTRVIHYGRFIHDGGNRACRRQHYGDDHHTVHTLDGRLRTRRARQSTRACVHA